MSHIALICFHNFSYFFTFFQYIYICLKVFCVVYRERGILMNKKELLEQNLNIFLENYIADLLQYHIKNDARISDLTAKKKKLYSQLKSAAFFDYDEMQNEILYNIAVLFYQNGFQDAVQLQKKLK